MPIRLTGAPAADALLEDDPFALLVAMLLDQQIPLERAFAAPLALRERLGGTLDPGQVAAMDPDAFAAVFAAKPALHRFPAAMAARVQMLARLVVNLYGGDAGAVWNTAASGAELVARVEQLPGFGRQKALIFVALLGKQMGVRPPGWAQAAEAFGEAGTYVSVADVDGPEALAKVRAHKAQVKAAAKATTATEGVAPRARRTTRRP